MISLRIAPLSIMPFFKCLCFFSFLFLGCLAPAAVIIDDFSTTQMIPRISSNCVVGPGIIGSERDAWLVYDKTWANVNHTVSGQLFYKNEIKNFNYLRLEYDGMDGDYFNHDYAGLGHLDLTDGGTCNALAFHFTQVPSYWVDIWVTIQQGSGRMSHIYTSTRDEPKDLTLLFEDFNTDPWYCSPLSVFSETESLPVDFTDVGYIHIEMAIWGAGDTFTLDAVTTDYIVPEPAMLTLLAAGAMMLPKRRK